jgi:hypothetical protein
MAEVEGGRAAVGSGVIDRERNWPGRSTGIHEWSRKARGRTSRKTHRPINGKREADEGGSGILRGH